MIKAVIFDLDGVLVNAKDWHYEALNKALGEFGFNIPRAEHVSVYDGLPTRKKLELLTMAKGLPVEHYDAIFDLKQHYTMELIEQNCVPTPQHEQALKQLHTEGYKLAVASNSTRPTVDTVLRKTRLQPYLEFALSNEDVQQTKPHPEIYQKAIARLGLRSDECLVIEDNINGIKAAKASGARLMIVETVDDVHLANIQQHINGVTAAAI